MRTLMLAAFLGLATHCLAAEARPAPAAQGFARSRPGLSPAQARLMAERGAQVVAARNLAATVRPAPPTRYGWQHSSYWVRGFRYGPTQYQPDGTASVTAYFLPE